MQSQILTPNYRGPLFQIRKTVSCCKLKFDDPGKVQEFCCDQILKITHLAWKSPGKVLEFGFDKSVGTLFIARSILETLAFTWEKLKTMDFMKTITA